jgi:hypothetical protein
MYSKSATRIRPRYSGAPVFRLEAGDAYGGFKAWGGSAIHGFQINAQTEGLGAIDLVGGNDSLVTNITSTIGAYPLEYGIRAQEGRDHDGQYSEFHRIKLPNVRNGVVWNKNCPDCHVKYSTFYGRDLANSRGVHVKGRNLTLTETSVQFFKQGFFVDAWEFEVNGGQWENHSGEALWADYAFKVGPGVQDMTVRSLSMANFSTVATVFVLDPAAKDYTFEYLSGHVSPKDVPPGFEDHFVWHRA